MFAAIAKRPEGSLVTASNVRKRQGPPDRTAGRSGGADVGPERPQRGERPDTLSSLCERAAASIRVVALMTHPGNGADALEHPAETYCALSATELLLDRAAVAMTQIADAFGSQVGSGVIQMDVGTEYADDVHGAACEVSAHLVDAATALEAAATAISRALPVLATAGLAPPWCA